MKKLILAAILMAGFAGAANAQKGENYQCPDIETSFIYWQHLCRFGYCEMNYDPCANDELFAPGGIGYDPEPVLPRQPARCSPAGWCEALGEEEILPW